MIPFAKHEAPRARGAASGNAGIAGAAGATAAGAVGGVAGGPARVAAASPTAQTSAVVVERQGGEAAAATEPPPSPLGTPLPPQEIGWLGEFGTVFADEGKRGAATAARLVSDAEARACVRRAPSSRTRASSSSGWSAASATWPRVFARRRPT